MPPRAQVPERLRGGPPRRHRDVHGLVAPSPPAAAPAPRRAPPALPCLGACLGWRPRHRFARPRHRFARPRRTAPARRRRARAPSRGSRPSRPSARAPRRGARRASARDGVRAAATPSKKRSSSSSRRDQSYRRGGLAAGRGEARAQLRVAEHALRSPRRRRAGSAAGIRQFSPSRQKSRLPCASVQTTGAPVAIASSGGRQKPSCVEVCTNTVAVLNSSLTSASLGAHVVARADARRGELGLDAEQPQLGPRLGQRRARRRAVSGKFFSGFVRPSASSTASRRRSTLRAGGSVSRSMPGGTMRRGSSAELVQPLAVPPTASRHVA